MKTISVLLLILFLGLNLQAQSLSPADSLLLKAKHQLDNAIREWSESDLQNARALFERLLNRTDKKFLVHYYIAYADYHLINFYQKDETRDQMEKFLDDGIQHLKQSIELNENFSESFALLSSLLGRKISLSPLKAIVLGPRSGTAITKAIQLEPENPRVHFIAGINAYFTPKMFGGGKDKARHSLKKALQLFEKYRSPSSLYPDWGYADTYAWLGIFAIDADSLNRAETYFQKALKVNPDFRWVKNHLLPKLREEKQKAGKENRD